MAGICYIIGAGDVEKLKIDIHDDDYVICADGGYDHAKKYDIKCDLLIGDFDSIDKLPVHDNILTFPSEKDETDMILAVNEGLKKEYKTFVIFGALGGSRFDHSLANIQLLSYVCKNNAFAVIVDGETLVTAIEDASLSFSDKFNGYVSVFSLSDKSTGVDIKGFKYEALNATMTNGFPIGVSNEFVGEAGFVSVESGVLLIVFNGDYREFLV